MSKVELVIFSDAHFHLWKNHNPNNRRTRKQMAAVEKIFKIAFNEKADLVFTGDMFQDPESLNNSLLSLVQPWFIELFNKYPVNLYGISGNHDMEETNSFKRRSPSYVFTLSNTIRRFNCIDFESVVLEDRGIALHGIPYITHNESIMDLINSIVIDPKLYNILLLHTDFQGQKDTNGLVIGKGSNIVEEDLKRFNLVLSGHIHKKGKVRENIYSVGSPYHTRLSDMGGSFGYWLLSRTDKGLKLKFKELDEGPKFGFMEEHNDPEMFLVPKPKNKAELMEASQTLDLSDKPKLISDYLKWSGDRSKSRRKYLKDLIERVRDEED